MAIMGALNCLVFLLVQLCSAAPSILFSINSQVPPVARVGQPFSFVFSPATFAFTDKVTYSLNNPPTWLSIDTAARRIYGTPTDGDIPAGQVVGLPIYVIATDTTGSTSMPVTLVVSRNAPPTVKLPISAQPPKFGAFSEPSTVLVQPDKLYSFGFDAGTFTDPAGIGLNYYAVMADSSPLPAWISFNPSSLTFSGKTPPSQSLIQPPQAYTVQLIASDVIGFSAASIVFTIVVGNHELITDQPSVVLNASVGTKLLYTGVSALVKLDGKPARPPEVTLVSTPNLPAWLSVDRNSWEISGTPSTIEPVTFAIILQDNFQDTLNVTMQVRFDNSSVFTSDIPELTVTAGQHFSYGLASFFRETFQVDAVVQPGPGADWISFDATTEQISGDVPAVAEDSILSATIQAKARGSDMIATKIFYLHVQAATSSSPSLLSVSNTASTAGPTTGSQTSGRVTAPLTTPASQAPTATPASSAHEDAPNPTRFKVVLPAVLIPTLLLLAAVLGIIFCLRRRRRARAKPGLDRRDISGPLPGSFVFNGAENDTESLRGLNNHFDIGKRGVASPSLGSVAMTRPQSAVPSVLGGRERAVAGSRADAERRSWLAVTASHAFRGGWKRRRKSTAKSYISDISMYDDGNEIPSQHSLALLGSGTGSRGSFRNIVEVNVPAVEAPPSIQHTPDFAYSGQGSAVSIAQMSSSPQATSSVPTQESLALVVPSVEESPSRPESRLDRHANLGTAKRLPKPWEVGAAAASSIFRGIKKQASLLSMSTIDTFAYKTQKTPEPAVYDNRDDASSAEVVRISVPPMPYAKVRSASQLSPAARPVTRRGPDVTDRWFGGYAGGARAFGIPSASAPKTRESKQSPSPPPMPQPSPAVTNQASMEVLRQVARDSLGVSYEDLVTNSPFHPSRTWSTIQSGEVATPEENGNEAISKPKKRPSVAVRNPKAATVPRSAANWTVLHDNNHNVDESPVIKDWRGSGSTKPDLMSPSQWPQAASIADSSSSGGGGGGNGKRRPLSDVSVVSPQLGHSQPELVRKDKEEKSRIGTAVSRYSRVSTGEHGGQENAVSKGSRGGGMGLGLGLALGRRERSNGGSSGHSEDYPVLI